MRSSFSASLETGRFQGTVLACRMSPAFCHLTVVPTTTVPAEMVPIQVRIGMTRRIPVGATIELSGCSEHLGQVLAAGIRDVGPVATAQSRLQARLRKFALS